MRSTETGSRSKGFCSLTAISITPEERRSSRTGLALRSRRPHLADRFLLQRLAETGRSYGITDSRDVTPDRWLAEGDQVDVAGIAFSVLHCPGHSPGSVVFVNRERRFALLGDVLFRGSVGRTDLPGGDHEALIRSIKSKLLPLGDEIAFVCGHGPTSTIGEERATNPFIL